MVAEEDPGEARRSVEESYRKDGWTVLPFLVFAILLVYFETIPDLRKKNLSDTVTSFQDSYMNNS